MKAVKQGWWSTHPTSGKRVGVVAEDYVIELEAELDAARADAARYRIILSRYIESQHEAMRRLALSIES